MGWFISRSLDSADKKSQYENINQKVNELTVVAGTIQTYLESVLSTVSKEKNEAESLISKEKEKLEQFHFEQNLLGINYINHLLENHDLTFEIVVEGIKTRDSLEELKEFYRQFSKNDEGEPYSYHCMTGENFRDLNKARQLLSKRPYEKKRRDREG